MVVVWVGFSLAVMCVCVCLFVCFPQDISKTDVARIAKLKCPAMSPGNPFILGSNGYGHRNRSVNAGFFCAVSLTTGLL